MGTLAKFQNPYFDFTVLDDSLVQQSYALRYEIYCEEQKFLSSESYPDKIETDEFDPRSIHIGAITRTDPRRVIGALRIIKAGPLGFPMNHHCKYDQNVIRRLGFDRSEELLNSTNVIEISRVVISPDYRRRANDGLYALSNDAQRRPPSQVGAERRSNRPVILLGLLKVVYQSSKRSGFNYWVVATERSLVRRVSKWQIVFEPIGPEIDYYGPVQPFFLEVADIERRMSQNIPDLMEEWLDGLEPEHTDWFHHATG